MPKFIDLSLVYHSKMRGVNLEQSKTLSEDGWNAKTLHLYSHSGTHMDAPWHFEVGSDTIDQTPLSKCIGQAWVIKLEGIEPKAFIYSDDLKGVKEKVQKGDSLLLHTGWSRYKDNPKIYRDELPRISQELAEWCQNKQINMLGVEPPSVADVNNLPEVTKIHQILLGANITIIEGITGLEQIQHDQVLLIALPIRILEGDGAPARVIAIEFEENEKNILSLFNQN